MKFLLAVVVMLVVGCGGGDRAEERCKSDCLMYGATFVRVSCDGDSCGEKESQWSCWCRRGAESGSGSEPLRIW